MCFNIQIVNSHSYKIPDCHQAAANLLYKILDVIYLSILTSSTLTLTASYPKLGNWGSDQFDLSTSKLLALMDFICKEEVEAG